MQWGIDAQVIIDGKDRSDDVASCDYRSGRYDVVFRNKSQVYSYNASKIRILKLVQQIDPQSVVCQLKVMVIADIKQIRHFGEFSESSEEMEHASRTINQTQKL